ncbi:unnamed protein product [Phytophthora lilii]|uniref:Unnamed protein product n=1 Tax=Phytophthora lilii TaxID=2077276 RepID=A0A9W6TGH4_9STRA|nr:unnamed protein product [Phytophthora lilii]
MAHVSLVGLEDDGDEAFDEPMDVNIVRKRQVSDEESRLWLGMFVGHPIAFIQPEGASMDERAFGLVTGYRMISTHAWLHVRVADTTNKIQLEHPPNVIKVGWVNYILQTGWEPTALS